MNVNGRHFRTIWLDPEDVSKVHIINQNALPHRFETMDLETIEDFIVAIREMYVRGAGLIGATAGFGMYVAALNVHGAGIDEYVRKAGNLLQETRPTAKNLEWAVKKQIAAIISAPSAEEKQAAALNTAREIADFDAECCKRIGEHGVSLIEKIATRKDGKPVNIFF